MAVDSLGRLTFRDRTPEDDQKRVAYRDAFRVAAGPVSVRPIAGDEDRRLVRVRLEVRAEPKLRPLFLACAADDFTLTTPGGDKLSAFTPGAKLELPFDGRGEAAELRLDFAGPSAPPDGPLTLTGEVRVTVAAGREQFAGYFAQADSPSGQLPVKRTESRGGVTIRFRDAVRKEDGTAEVELAVVYDEGGPAFESHRSWVYHNDAAVEYDTERGGERTRTRLDHDPGVSVVAQAGGGVVLRYRFSAVPPDAKNLTFLYAAPTNIVEVPVEFTIEGLPVMAEPRKSEDGAAEDSRDADF